MASQRTVYVSGSFVPESEAAFSIFDSALMYGDVIFETTRTFNGQVFRLREHIERLYVGLRTLEIDCGLTAEEMEAATLETIERNRPSFADGRDFQIVHNVSRGPMGLYKTVFGGEVGPTDDQLLAADVAPGGVCGGVCDGRACGGTGAAFGAVAVDRSEDQEPQPDLLSDGQLASAEGGPGGVGPVDGRGRVPD